MEKLRLTNIIRASGVPGNNFLNNNNIKEARTVIDPVFHRILDLKRGRISIQPFLFIVCRSSFIVSPLTLLSLNKKDSYYLLK